MGAHLAGTHNLSTLATVLTYEGASCRKLIISGNTSTPPPTSEKCSRTLRFFGKIFLDPWFKVVPRSIVTCMANLCGWYHIDEVWNLYVDASDPVDDTHRVLKPVRVDFICVDEQAEGDDYVVDHYDPQGEKITRLTLDYDDLRDVTLEREETDRPHHI